MKNNYLVSLFHTIIKQGSTCRILLYHRVADVKDDPHLLGVSVSNFTDQIDWLKKNCHIISLSKLFNQIKHNTLDSKSVCITFDDGYADNFYNALPVLKQFQVPATIFITSGMIDKRSPFYWDENTHKKDQGRALNKIELEKLAKESLIEIGSHTITHPRLSTLSAIDQEIEIEGSKRELESIINKNISGFSYPFGTKKDYSKETVNIVKRANYKYACANFSGKATRFSNPYELPRIIIRNWPIGIFVKKMRRTT